MPKPEKEKKFIIPKLPTQKRVIEERPKTPLISEKYFGKPEFDPRKL